MTHKQVIIWGIIIVLILGSIIISIGIGIGFILSKLIPGLEIGMGIIAGAIFSIGIIDFLIRLIVGLNENADDMDDLESEESHTFFPKSKLEKLREKKNNK